MQVDFQILDFNIGEGRIKIKCKPHIDGLIMYHYRTFIQFDESYQRFIQPNQIIKWEDSVVLDYNGTGYNINPKIFMAYVASCQFRAFCENVYATKDPRMSKSADIICQRPDTCWRWPFFDIRSDPFWYTVQSLSLDYKKRFFYKKNAIKSIHEFVANKMANIKDLSSEDRMKTLGKIVYHYHCLPWSSIEEYVVHACKTQLDILPYFAMQHNVPTEYLHHFIDLCRNELTRPGVWKGIVYMTFERIANAILQRPHTDSSVLQNICAFAYEHRNKDVLTPMDPIIFQAKSNLDFQTLSTLDENLLLI